MKLRLYSDVMTRIVNEVNKQVFGNGNTRVAMHEWLQRFISKIEPERLAEIEPDRLTD